MTDTEAEAIQPFEGSVTVIVYAPGEETVLVVLVLPPPQSYVTPGVVEEAVSVTVVTVHVNAGGGAILTFGGEPLCDMVVEAVAVHPFVGSVTVTVYVPPEVAVYVLVVTPPPQL
jgi:hypothetical protein